MTTERRPIHEAFCRHGKMERDERSFITVLSCPKGCYVEVSHVA
jgi:hypothetical protein